MSKQICYVIINPAWPEWVKIGFTSKEEMKTRLSTYQTGSPFRDYEVYHEVYFDDAKAAEKEVNKRLKQMNATQGTGKEWYKMPKSIASNMIDSVLDDLEEGSL
ncbi:hypothetical protein [Yersinia phage fHe-Yen9-04]|uniref:Bacteriophage T5 Orf172 DNA-binding domain-containing protein n=1 Tax=Yersinia phage fHe-Yen9-04 TaxID=2052742 RepID=A0A2C9CX97_9CAUD|nr:hypothetical protein FDJ41_gp252 [Yersinia phage fHe-Yen9-04]SOK58529.1 hypothetical protein [Yersinia phage fHe-Yen9-04]VUE36298.1 hypothetical protein [Yersinia phage fHe-Yen9-04]